MNKNKIKKIGKVTIIYKEEEIKVKKEKRKDLKNLFNYFENRNIIIHPKLIDEDSNYEYYEYFNSINNDEAYKNIGKTLGDLHYRTSMIKKISKRKHKDVYEKIIDNIDSIKEEYTKRIEKIDKERYMSPSDYLLARNYTIIYQTIIKSEKNINSWYNIVKDKEEERVVVVHNNLKRNNIHSTPNTILTGWDNYIIDTPVLDIYKLYKNEYKEIDIIKTIKDYSEENELTKEDKLLLKALIYILPTTNNKKNELEKIKTIKELLYYIKISNNIEISGVLN